MTDWGRFGGFLPFDTRVIRELDGLRRRELRLRIPFLAMAVALLIYLYALWWVLAWFILRVAFSVAFLIWARNLPEKMSGGQLAPFVAFVLLDGISYNILSVYLWWLDDRVLDLFALAVVTTFMLSTSWLRSESALLWICDTIAFGVTVLMVPVLHYISGAPFAEAVILFGVFAMVIIYFVMAKWSIWQARAGLRRGISTEIERAKSDAVGKVAGGMAHDFNNLLTVVLGNLELARLSPRPGERGEYLEEAEKAARRGADMIGQLLAFSRKLRLEVRKVPVAEIIEGVTPLMSNMLGNRHWVTVRPLPDLPPVRVDAGKVQSVLLELVLNARDALPYGGEIVLEVKAGEDLGRPAVVITVIDQGEGITADCLEHVCEPFFSTKPSATGLGLSMATGIAAQSGGRLDITSYPGEGTVVSVCLPAAVEEA